MTTPVSAPVPPTEHLSRRRLETLIDARELLDVAGVGGHSSGARTLDERAIATAIEHANRTVEGYVRGRYPGGTTDPVLERCAFDIARYTLRTDLTNNTVSDDIRARHKDAMQTLRDVQRGTMHLQAWDGSPAGDAPGPAGGVSHSAPPARLPGVIADWRGEGRP